MLGQKKKLVEKAPKEQKPDFVHKKEDDNLVVELHKNPKVL